MKLSIIIPVYNGEDFIENSLLAALNQTVEEKEIICIDDGSTDGTQNLIKRMQQKYPGKIVLIEQENQGAAVARNKGLDRATGDYIAFLDADDYYYADDVLEKMVTTADKLGVCICGSFRMVDRNGKLEEAPTYRDIFANDTNPKILKFADYQYDYYYVSYVFRRTFIEDNALRFPLLRRYQDPPFFAKAMSIAKVFGVIPINMYCVRARNKALVFSETQINDSLVGINMNIELAIEQDYPILLANSVKRLNEDLYYAIRKSISEGNYHAVEILFSIRKRLESQGYGDKIKVLNEMLLAWTGYKDKECWAYEFPYSKIPYGSKVILYGAGNVGRHLLHQMKLSGYAQIVLWADKRWRELQELEDKVFAPEKLVDVEADYIVIAVEKKELYDEISEEIIHALSKDCRDKLIGPISPRRERNTNGLY